MYFQYFKEDIQETYPIEGMIVPPYTDEMDREQKIKISYQNLQRSIRLKQRIIALMNAYFLGRLLSEIESTTERFVIKRKLTKHYQTMVDNTFDLFEFRPSQILRTKVISVQAIRVMKHSQILELRELTLVTFAGAQNLEEESC
jgi:hypothetical protein